MKVVQINSVCGKGSTGKICASISNLLTEQGIENYILHTTDGNTHPLGVQYMSSFSVKIQALKAKVFGNYGFQTRIATKRLIKKLDEISPDIVQLHNLHGHNVNFELLFKYLKKKNKKIYWTFHDCWAFTSYCMYFDMVGCDEWKTGCKNCPQRKHYSWFLDRSEHIYKKKKKLLSGLDLNIITPSRWLADLVKKSFLGDYPIKVINNGIDLSIFKPSDSDFRERYNIPKEKIILLGVANVWEARKGLDAFLYLADNLDAEKYQIVLVGTNDLVDKILPKKIISIHRTSNQKELAEIYSAANLFINPTREDNFPTVNLESLACGTPIITFDTGGSSECLAEGCGCKIPCGNKQELCSLINGFDDIHLSRKDCLNRAVLFDQNEKFKEYLELYQVYE